MRYIMCFAAILFVTSAVYADVVELELRKTPANKPIWLLPNSSDSIKYTRLDSQPEGYTAPEGELQWGTITLGETEHVICVKFTEPDALLYLDWNGDKDLAGEEPVKRRRFSNFELKDVPAVFKVNGSSLSTRLSLRLSPKYKFRLAVYSYYAGNINVEGKESRITWIPGQDPVIGTLRRKGRGQIISGQRVISGRKSLKLSREAISIKDGKVMLTYSYGVDESLIPATVPQGLSTFNLFTVASVLILCKPEDGKIYLPEGSYLFAMAVIDKTRGKDKWQMTLRILKFKAAEGFSLGEMEPLTLNLLARLGKGTVSIKPSFTDSAGRHVLISKNRKKVPAPVIVIKDAKGNEVARESVKYG